MTFTRLLCMYRVSSVGHQFWLYGHDDGGKQFYGMWAMSFSSIIGSKLKYINLG